MILKKINITNFKGIKGTKEINFDLFNSIVGRNDAGKSTILKAIDACLNNTTLQRTDFNVEAEENQIVIELHFDPQNKTITLGEELETSIEGEEITNAEYHLVYRKIWNVTETNISKPKTSILRKEYDAPNDFILKTETQLIAQCTANNIETTKGNGDEFNNVEKRQKLREHNATNNVAFNFDYFDIPSSGSSKPRLIGDAIKKSLPSFQYFKADTSLSDTDTTIQKYFKDLSFKLINEEVNTEEIEDGVKEKLEEVLQNVTNKINEVVNDTEKVEPKISFDWSKLISTSFVSNSSGKNIPLSSRGDGFRRITMMSYFEYLAEANRSDDTQQIIFGFEEPETFLHPSAQENLFDKLNSLAQNGFQVITSTHSPTIVGHTNKEDIIHITNPAGEYTVEQTQVDYKALAVDLGIKPDNTFTPLFANSQLLFLVEGIDDAIALNYQSEVYKQNGLIDRTFEELNVSIIPIGGCGGIKHWVNLDLFTKLEKPFHIFLDSDKNDNAEVSQNYTNLINYGLAQNNDFSITKKRMLENYIHPSAIHRLVPGCTINYGDFDHAKNFCKRYPDSEIRANIGGGNVIERHYRNLTFGELRMTWYNGTDDEFLELYQLVRNKL